MLKVAIAVLFLSIPVGTLLWLRWKADRRRQIARNAAVRASVDAMLDQAKLKRAKTAGVRETRT